MTTLMGRSFSLSLEEYPWGHPKIQSSNLHTFQGGIVRMLEQAKCARLDFLSCKVIACQSRASDCLTVRVLI